VIPLEPHADLLLAPKVSDLLQFHHWLASCQRSPRWKSDNGPFLQCLVKHQGRYPGQDKLDIGWCRPEWYWIPLEGWVCSLGTRWLTKQMAHLLWLHMNGIPMAKFWKTKSRISDSLWNTIDWQGLEWTYGESKVATCWWAVKYTLGFFAHGKNMTWWQFSLVSECPQCQATIKHKLHIA